VTSQEVTIAYDRYRVLALLTGSVLLFLTFVALPYKYILDGPVHWTGGAWMVHGWLYVIYLILTIDLGLKMKWPVTKMILIALAGTVPFMAFVTERRLRSQIQG